MSPEYLAGLFDGEGCIDVQRSYTKNKYGVVYSRTYVRPRVRMRMANSSRIVCDLLHARFGGHIIECKAGKSSQQDSWSLEWLNRDSMLHILNLMLPHLILKREQAKLVLWWLENASGRNLQSGYPGMEQARQRFVTELKAMKLDPQRLSERAAEHIALLMRQSDPCGDVGRVEETTTPLAV